MKIKNAFLLILGVGLLSSLSVSATELRCTDTSTEFELQLKAVGQISQEISPHCELLTSQALVDAEIRVAGDWMGVGFQSLWEPSGKSLKRIDPQTNKVIAEIELEGSGPYRGLSFSEDSVWLADASNHKLYKIDAKQNQVTRSISLPMTGSEGSIAVGGGSVWIATNASESAAGTTLTRIDEKTGQKLADIPLASTINGIAFAKDKVFLTATSANKVFVADAKSGAVIDQIAVDKLPRFISSAGQDVWIANQGTGSVQKIDPITNRVISTIDAGIPGGGGDIYDDGDFVWASTFGKPIVKISKSENRVVATVKGDEYGDAIRPAFGSLWVSGSKLHRVKIPSTACTTSTRTR